MNNELSLLQVKLLNNMNWFHNFCVSHELRYYLLGGSMLGAARHKGFIPWDDDIDVGMPRKDYDKLADLMGGSILDGLVLETPSNGGDDYYYSFSKLYDTSTTLIENYRTKVKRGVYIDIFPLDGMGNTEEEALKNYRSIGWKQNVLLARVGGIRKGRAVYKNASIVIARLIPGSICNEKRLLQRIEEECSSRDFDDCLWGGNPSGAWRFKEIMPRGIMGTPSLYEFEDHLFFGPEKSDEYLTRLYGDWRQLPPPERRISHHDYVFCDLNRSYLYE